MQLELTLRKAQTLLEALNYLAQQRPMDEAESDLIQEMEEIQYQLEEISGLDLDECEGGACKL